MVGFLVATDVTVCDILDQVVIHLIVFLELAYLLL